MNLNISNFLPHYISPCSEDWMWEIDAGGHYTYCSENIYKLLGFRSHEILGKQPFELMSEDEADRVKSIFEKICRFRKPIVNLENWNISRNGNKKCLLTNGVPILDDNGKILGYKGIDRDITNQKRLEILLQEKDVEINELKATLKILLQQRTNDKKDFEDSIIDNVMKMIMPFLEQLKNSRLSDQQNMRLEAIQTNLEKIIDPFCKNLTNTYKNLTPTEIKIIGLIRDGKSTKEMSLALGNSLNAIKFHRYNIRKKLNLQNKGINLRSYLLSLQEE